MSGGFLGFLVESGRLDAAAAARVSNATASAGQSVDIVLLELGLLPEHELANAQARYLGTRIADPEHYPDVPILQDVLPISFLRNNSLIPLAMEEGRLIVAMGSPFNAEAIEALSYYLGYPVEAWVARRAELETAYRRIYEGADGEGAVKSFPEGPENVEDSDVERLKDIAREAPVIRFFNRLINDAVERRASDIHLEPLADKVLIRFRIDGVLAAFQSIDKTLHAGVTSRVKILAKLNIAERRLPQDGRISLAIRGREIDFRVSTVPALHGESVVLRILDRQELRLDFASLGFDPEAAASLSRTIHQPNGIVLVAGPTGSGKTTTLYTAIRELRSKERKILTIEDPVEYHLDAVIQMQVKPQIGLDFATGLRAFLRQDPDVIMVGEIRDGETARTAVQASLTGHLVLSTVHTNDAAATVTRLIDMGVENYLLVSTLRAVIAQRLVRRLCQKCKIARSDSQALLIANSMRRRMELQTRLKAALAYPVILLCMSLLTIALVAAVLVPNLLPLFDGEQSRPPFIIRLFGVLNSNMAGIGVLLLAIALSATVMARSLARNESFLLARDEILLRVPIVGPLIGQAETIRTANTLGLLLNRGIALTQALAMAQSACRNRRIRSALASAVEKVAAGGRLARAFAECSVMPPPACHLAAVGEESNRLDEMMLHIAQMNEQDMQNRLERLLNLLTPALTLFMGLLVAGLITAVMNAILSVNEMVLQ